MSYNVPAACGIIFLTCLSWAANGYLATLFDILLVILLFLIYFYIIHLLILYYCDKCSNRYQYSTNYCFYTYCLF
jgi:hypothetical protein